MASILEQVEDAHKDKYEMEFEIEIYDGFPVLICPLCGHSLQDNITCAEGHIAYSIIDEEGIESAMNDALFAEANDHTCPKCGEHFTAEGKFTDEDLIKMCPVRHEKE